MLFSIYKFGKQRYLMSISQGYHKNSTNWEAKSTKKQKKKEALTSIIQCHSQYDNALLG